ncbi:XdhC family protein [Arthrobacter sp. P2b]|uniref:XdhC family protein n=1 Tax=Arthrobacter sp. P2b TaxID=1938741 RepID=UPI0009A75622|nr:XdhC family protein [Arthrobacter sp. P2b]SLK14753.1 xanthine dehydrogenase accessory factor [Arthrobacter sp. P2b]
MKEVISELSRQLALGQPAALATVVRTQHSAPRPEGSSMLRLHDGSAVGSISGGCVEGAVYELGAAVLASGKPELESYGFSDDDAFAVGLTCGGILDIFVEPVTGESFPELNSLVAAIGADRPVALATVIASPEPSSVGRHLVIDASGVRGTTGDPKADNVIADDARGLLASGTSSILTYGPEGQRLGTGVQIFVNSFAPKPRMIVFGAVDFASALAQQGKFLGYHVTVCDARPIFATPARFPSADAVVVQWPHKYLEDEASAGRIDANTVLCVLTHDPKFDVPVIDVALRLPAIGYLGAMGSQRTHQDRVARLLSVGLPEEQISRMASPIGLDIGGRTPEETAVSIAAEIVASRWGGSGRPLSNSRGRIHSPERRSVVSTTAG